MLPPFAKKQNLTKKCVLSTHHTFSSLSLRGAREEKDDDDDDDGESSRAPAIMF